MFSRQLSKFVLAMLILGFSALSLMASQDDPRTKVPHIDAKTALQLFKSSKIILIDVHPGDVKKKSDIVGALYVPSIKLAELKPNAPPGVLIGIFCN